LPIVSPNGLLLLYEAGEKTQIFQGVGRHSLLMRICLPRYRATETARALEICQTILRKLFPYTPIEGLQNLSVLSRNQLIERIEANDVLHDSDMVA